MNQSYFANQINPNLNGNILNNGNSNLQGNFVITSTQLFDQLNVTTNVGDLMTLVLTLIKNILTTNPLNDNTPCNLYNNLQ